MTEEGHNVEMGKWVVIGIVVAACAAFMWLMSKKYFK